MKTLNLLICVYVLAFFSGCATSPVSWDSLETNLGNTGYCNDSYSVPQKIERCKIEMAARKRAKVACTAEKKRERCEVMARYSWNSMKKILKNKPDMFAAQNYPIMCGYDKPVRRLCSKAGAEKSTGAK